MPDRKRSKRLHDVSHLFLSGSAGADSGAGVSFTSRVYLCISGDPCYRGFISSGLSSAVSAENIPVTLLETGYSMPNAGYYFSFEPEEYLSTTLGGRKGFKKKVNDYLRYSYASRYADLERYDDPFSTPSALQLTIEAFGPAVPGGTMADQKILADLSSKPVKKYDHIFSRGRTLVIFDCCGEDDWIDYLCSAFRTGSSSDPIFVIGMGKGNGPGRDPSISGYSERYLEMPPGFMKDLGKRIPPVSTFMRGLAGSITRSIASVEKERRKNAVI
ncbi:MAG: hypothetical protein JW746_01200 [Candidatus Krumholzibacteriota bacterium]|nr:hypothetical protein [Candidatus Krumholzibacteriota bacterium]